MSVGYRKLINHPESDSLFEVFTPDQYINAMQEGCCDDVTDIEKFEKQFKEQQDYKNKMFGDEDE